MWCGRQNCQDQVKKQKGTAKSSRELHQTLVSIFFPTPLDAFTPTNSQCCYDKAFLEDKQAAQTHYTVQRAGKLLHWRFYSCKQHDTHKPSKLSSNLVLQEVFLII